MYEKTTLTNQTIMTILSFMNETQIKVAARKIARKATTLRKQGRHDEADAIVREAAVNVEAFRAAGKVV